MMERNESVLQTLFANGIYSWLNLILLGWTLGLVWLACRALTTKGTLRDKAARALTEERFLFGDWAGDVRQTAGGWLFLGAVVLLHSTSKTNAEILDELLTKWEEEGYSFAPLTDLCA